MHKRLLLVFGLSLLMSSIMAQMPSGGQQVQQIGKIFGSVVEEKTEKPIQYANVVVKLAKDSSLVTGTITDKMGLFIIDKLTPGVYYMEVDFIGYDKIYISTIKINGQNTEYDAGIITLEQSSELLNSAVVSDEKIYMEYHIDKKVINVTQELISAGETAVEILENTPSVETDIDGNVSLRGSSNFTVLIDGKPTVLDPSDALKAIPASTIESIEIITNPSAKYDPEGVGGIINIITKENKLKGFSGLVSLSGGTFNNYSGSLSLNYKTNKWTFTVGGDYSNRQRVGYSETEQITTLDPANNYYLLSNGVFGRGGKNGSAKLGIGYDISKNSSVLFTANYGLRNFARSEEADYHSFYADIIRRYDDEYYNQSNISVHGNTYYSGNLNFFHKFNNAEHNIEVNAYYAARNGDDYQLREKTYTDDLYNEILGVAGNTDSIIEDGTRSDYRFKIDYTYPINKNTKLEAGLQSKNTSSDKGYFQFALDSASNQYEQFDSLTNQTSSHQYIQAAYTTLSGKLWTLEYMLGLRGEYTDRALNSITTGIDYDIPNRFDIFPTIHLSKELPFQFQIQASYSKRISRPRNFYLDPFVYIINDNTIMIGNPEVMPEYTHSYELNIQKRIPIGFISLESYYKLTNNVIDRLSYLRDDGIVVTTFDNIAQDRRLGVEFMANLYLQKWWTVNVMGDLYNYRIIDADENIDSKTFTWNTRVNTAITIKKTNTKFQISGMYVAPSISAQGSSQDFFMADFAIKQSFLKNQLGLTFSFRDILSTMNHETTVETENIYYHNIFDMAYPSIKLTLTYNFNNFKQTSDKENIGIEDESSL